jgi:ribosomal protein S18 acetylase RimI-like enzyme
MISTRKASRDDAGLLTTLANEIYTEHYLYLWLPGGAQWYMEEYAYNRDKIKNDLGNPGIEYFIAFDDGYPIAYMKLLLDATLQDYSTTQVLEVERIYVRKSAAGKGLGKQLMELAMQKARALKKEVIFLKAMDSGTDAIAFYERLGFSLCGRLQLPVPEFALMKPEYRGMVVLKKEV